MASMMILLIRTNKQNDPGCGFMGTLYGLTTYYVTRILYVEYREVLHENS